MLLSTGDGIRCDRCGLEHRDEFTYYSYDAKELTLQQGKLPTDRRRLKTKHSFDICTSCMAHYAGLIRKFYKYLKSGIACDHCGKIQKPTDKIWFIQVTEVKVAESQSVDPDFVELCLCEPEIETLKASKLKQAAKQSWSTSSGSPESKNPK